MKTAVLYIRVSSDDQVRGTSLGTQEAENRAWCDRNGYTVAEIFRDEGESAKTADRPGLINAIARVHRGGIDALIVHKLDRLARNTTDGLAIRADLRRHNCSLLSATETAGDDPVGEMVSTVLMAVAQFDNQVRAARAKSGMVAVVQAGGWAWAAPHGYKTARQGNLAILEPDAAIAPILALAIKGYADGSLDHLQATAMIAKTGLKLSHAGELLKMPVYGGLIVSKLTGGKEVKAAFRGLVDAATWRKAADRAATRDRKPRKHKTTYLAVGVATCGVCGRKLRACVSRGRWGGLYDYYFCPDKHVRVQASKIHDRLKAMLAEWPAVVGDIRARVLKHVGASQKEWTAIRANAETRRNAAEARLSRLIDGYADRIIDADTYQRKAAQYRAQVADADIEARAAQHTVSVILTGLDKIIDSLADPMSLWLSASLPSRIKIAQVLSGGFAVEKHPTPKAINSHAGDMRAVRGNNEVARPFERTSNPVEVAARLIEAFGIAAA